MNTFAVVWRRRSYSPTMFDDLDLPPHSRTRVPDKETGLTTITFADDLTEEQQAAVRARVESTDDADQAARALLRVLRSDTDTGGIDEIRAAVVGAIDYMLGD